jgi:predicted  nucleic acid-binding Zn-ribbon protein
LISELTPLIRLQGIDLEIRKIRQKKEKLPERLDALQERVSGKEAGIEEMREKIKDIRKRKIEIEDELELETERMKKSQQKMSAVQNNREYQALNKEIEEIKKANKTREDELLDLLEEIKKLEDAVAEGEKELKADKKEAAAEEKHIKAIGKDLDKKIDVLSREGEAVAAEVKPDLLAKYRFLAERRQGLVVAAVTDSVCSACNMNIPPQMFNELLREERMMTCPSCQRLIYALKTDH